MSTVPKISIDSFRLNTLNKLEDGKLRVIPLFGASNTIYIEGVFESASTFTISAPGIVFQDVTRESVTRFRMKGTFRAYGWKFPGQSVSVTVTVTNATDTIEKTIEIAWFYSGKPPYAPPAASNQIQLTEWILNAGTDFPDQLHIDADGGSKLNHFDVTGDNIDDLAKVKPVTSDGEIFDPLEVAGTLDSNGDLLADFQVTKGPRDGRNYWVEITVTNPGGDWDFCGQRSRKKPL